jgi:flavin-dependent dehydrogenase
MQEPPFIAVGGGLAGAAFALELARNGAPVSVLESTRGPHHKVCGEFLSAEAQGLIAYLGIDLAALGATSIGRFRLAAAGRRADAPLPFRAAGLSRHLLDQAMLQAAEKAGAVVERGVTVSEMNPADGRVALRAGSRTFTAKAVALATGKHALRQYPRRPSDMVGFKLQLRLAPGAHAFLENVVQLVMFNGGYVGALIVEDRLANFCWVLHGALLKRVGADWPSQAAYFAAQSELLGELLRGAEPCWDKPVAVAAVPYGYLRTDAIAANILPVGDQLAVIPSFTGEGMAISLYSGIAAAQAVLAGEAAASFQRRLTDRLRPQFRVASAINRPFDSAILNGPAVWLAAGLPRLVTWLVQSTRLKGFDDVIRPVPMSAERGSSM